MNCIKLQTRAATRAFSFVHDIPIKSTTTSHHSEASLSSLAHTANVCAKRVKRRETRRYWSEWLPLHTLAVYVWAGARQNAPKTLRQQWKSGERAKEKRRHHKKEWQRLKLSCLDRGMEQYADCEHGAEEKKWIRVCLKKVEEEEEEKNMHISDHDDDDDEKLRIQFLPRLHADERVRRVRRVRLMCVCGWMCESRNV